MLQRAKVGAGMLAIGVAMAVWPAASASAGVDKSSICQAYQAEVKKQTSASTKLQKVIEGGSWTTIKKAMLSTFTQETADETKFNGYLKGASSKVKAAAAVALKLDASFKPIIAKSTSLKQFEAKIGAAESTAKVKSALTVLNAYSTTLCGSSTSST